MFLFVACDLGRMGGGVDDAAGTGSESDFGTKLDRTRMLLFGDAPRSTAEADRAGGGATFVPLGSVPPDLPGDAVCDLEGGGGGVADLGGSVPPAYADISILSTHYPMCPHLFINPAFEFFVVNERCFFPKTGLYWTRGGLAFPPPPANP